MSTAVKAAQAHGLTDREKDLRKNYLGASETAAVMGFNPWSHGSDIYHRRVNGVEVPETEMMRLGQALEPVILERAALEIGSSISRVNRRRVHPSAPMQATVDGFVVGQRAIVEAKLTHPFAFKKAQERPEDFWGEDGTDQIPRYHLIQVMHQLAVLTASTGEPWDTAYLAVMVGIEDFHLYRVQRHPELCNEIVAAVTEFWDNHIVLQVPPNDDGPKLETIARLPRVKGKEITDLDPELIPAYEQAHADTKAAEDIKTAAKTAILKVMGDADRAVDTNGRVVTYNQITSNKFDKKGCADKHPDIVNEFTVTSQYRRFAVKAAKTPKKG